MCQSSDSPDSLQHAADASHDDLKACFYHEVVMSMQHELVENKVIQYLH